MPFDNVLNRSAAAGTIEVKYSNELIDMVATEESQVMRLARKLRNMTAYEEDLPVLSALAVATIAETDTSLRETGDVSWDNVRITAKEVNVIVPVPKNVLDDANIPIWDQVKPVLAGAAGKAIDRAVLYGEGKPTAWPSAIVTGALAAGHNVSLASFTDLYDAVLGESGVFGLVEADGYGVSGSIADLSMKGKYRSCRDADGNPIFQRDPSLPGAYMLDGSPILFPRNGAGSSTYKQISGDWSQLVYSMRSDMTFDVFTEGVIQDGAGKIVFNLMQQRMAAIMLTMRLGFALPNPINPVNTNSATRYPFAYLTA